MTKYIGSMHRVIAAAKLAADSRCLYHDRKGQRCKCAAIQSHSIQRRGPLASIAENGHIVKIGPLLKAQPANERKTFIREGVGNASTFTGFCAQHDTEVFRSLEVETITLSARIAVIIAIRSIALELYRKNVMIEMQRETLDFLGPSADPQKVLFAQLIMQGSKHAQVENIKRLKQLFFAYHKEPPFNFQYICLEFKSQAPFACAGAFEPEWSLDKTFLYRTDPMKTGWNSVSLFCGNIRGRFYAMFAGFQKFHNHRIDKFFRSIDVSSPTLVSDIFTIALVHSENCFVKESWLDSLNQNEKLCIEGFSRSGMLEGVRDPSVFDRRVRMPENELVQTSIWLNQPSETH